MVDNMVHDGQWWTHQQCLNRKHGRKPLICAQPHVTHQQEDVNNGLTRMLSQLLLLLPKFGYIQSSRESSYDPCPSTSFLTNQLLTPSEEYNQPRQSRVRLLWLPAAAQVVYTFSPYFQRRVSDGEYFAPSMGSLRCSFLQGDAKEMDANWHNMIPYAANFVNVFTLPCHCKSKHP